MKIGILRGQENTFPDALIARINEKAEAANQKITAEYIMLGGTKMDDPCEYSVILDRISQDIDYYRTFLKHAVLQGAYVINNPFWWSADDKYFNYAVAHKMGIAVPKTVVLPQNQHPEGTTSESMRNLVYPLDWDNIFDYVGFPAFLKPHSGGGWKMVYKVHSRDDFFYKYNQTGTTCMVLQEGIEFEQYYRCYCVGGKYVHIMPYAPLLPPEKRYVTDGPPIEPKLEKRMNRDILTICKALGYDLNTVEFAVRDGVPYAIDYMNPAPDADYHSVTRANFDWIVETMADFCIECTVKRRSAIKDLHWAKFLKPQSSKKAGSKSV
ncbi:MAG: hypothetical protein E2O78_07970 [Caldithrix sp.]|nr:MAG: hypothetical protein E2O78_07970 [Caldithrix sp.]